MSIYEYDQEEHIRLEREDAFEDGRKVGKEEGREEGRKEGREEGIGLGCCSSNYLRLRVALYLQLFSRLSRMQHHIIQARLCTLNTVIPKRSTLFNPNEIAGSKNIRVFCNV